MLPVRVRPNLQKLLSLYRRERIIKYRHAIKLHNGDQVTIKATREVVTCLSVFNNQSQRLVVLSAMTADGYRQLTHLEVE